MRLVLDVKVVAVRAQHVFGMPITRLVVLHAQFLDVVVAVKFEEEGLSVDWFTAAT